LNNERSYCKNCFHPLNTKNKYCSNCGQKNTDGKLTIGNLLSNLFSTVFNLESKFFTTLRDIVVPGKLTIEYFKGKHKSYFHPVRLFIVSTIILLAAVSYFTGEAQIIKFSIPTSEEKIAQKVQKKDFLNQLDSITNFTKSQYNNSEVSQAIDSVRIHMRADSISSDSIDFDQVETFWRIDRIGKKIAEKDFINLSGEEICNKYQVKGFKNKFLVKQKLKLAKDPAGFSTFLIGNIVWVMLLMMPFLALLLKLLYIRHPFYYVEHLIFSFHIHSFLFLMGGIAALFYYWFEAMFVGTVIPVLVIIAFVYFSIKVLWSAYLEKNWKKIIFRLLIIGSFSIPFFQTEDYKELFIVLFFVLISYYPYRAMRNVYKQGRWKTFGKMVVINISYLFLFLLASVFGLLVGLLIF